MTRPRSGRNLVNRSAARLLHLVVLRLARVAFPRSVPDCSLRNLPGAAICHATASASRTALSGATRRRTFVAPLRPQPPLTGAKAVGVALMKASCCSGSNFTTAQLSSGHPRVAKIRPPTRKWRCSMCPTSREQGSARASRRNVAGVTASTPGRHAQSARAHRS
jgi:hypothetical protein